MGYCRPSGEALSHDENCAYSAFFALVLLATRPAAAAGTALDLSVGTLGIAGGIVEALGPATDARLTYGDVAFGRTQNFGNLVIDVTANLTVHESFRLRTVGLFADRVLHGGPLHVSAGIIYNLNQVNGVSVPTDSSIVISGITYSQATAGRIYTVVRWPALAPYLGIGFGPPLRTARGAHLFGDIGAYYQGKSRVEFSATGAIAANYAKFQPYFDERRRQLQAELAPVAVFPVAQLGLRSSF